ncbi:MAG: tail fiber domain-containing protein [Sarcina sp.]
MFMTVEDENGRVVTIWHSDNFTPDHYLQKAGGIMSGVLKIHNKLFVSELPGFQDAEPTISLAIGDSDTGFHSEGDGQIAFYSNGVRRYNLSGLWGSHNFDPNGKLNTTGGTINGNLTVTGAFSAGSISCSGRVTTQSISIAGSNFDPNSKFNTAGGTITGSVTVHGWVHSNNDVTAFSDKRLKNNIKALTEDEIISNMNKINIYKYNLLDSETEDYGVIAQELEEIFPTLVVENTEEDPEVIESLGFNPKRVRYSQFIPLLISYTQSLEKRISELEKQNKK